MRNLSTPLVIIVLLTIASSCTMEPVDAKEEIQAANELFMKALNTGDVDALADIYMPDAIVCPPNSEMVTGADNIIALMTATPVGIMKMVFETVSAESFGSTAIELGKYKVLSPDESMVFDHGKYIVIWKKDNEVWKVSKDIYNTSNPPPPETSSEEAEPVKE